MAQIVRVKVALIVGVLFLLPTAWKSLAFENVCSANPCPVGQVCVQGFLGPLCLQECAPNRCSATLVCLQGSFGPRCEELRCNFDSECPNSRPRCRNPMRAATIVGCQRGLVCMQGTCQRPPA